MADYRYVEMAIEWLENQWDTSNYPGAYDGQQPAIIDKTSTESQEYDGKKLHFDPQKNNAVVISPSPNATNELVGTEANYRFEDGIAVMVKGFSGSYGHISEAAEFRALYQEARRILNGEQEWPDPDGSKYAYTLQIGQESNLSHEWRDHYEYDMTVLFRGHEEL